MSEKINPGWVNNRLPTEEDGNQVLYILEDGFNICRKSYENIKKGQVWCVPPDTSKIKCEFDIAHEVYNSYIALPQECLDREKNKGKQEKCVLTNKQLEDIIGALHNSSNGMEIKLRNKIKDLKQTLVKEQQDHVQTMAEGKKFIVTSKECVKELSIIIENSCKTIEDLTDDNQALKKFLIKEWGG